LSSLILKEAKRLASLSSTPLQPLSHNHRAFSRFINGQVIRDAPLTWFFSVLDLDDNRAILPPCLQLPPTSPAIPRMTQSELEAFRQEIKNIENRRFSTSVGAEKNHYRGDFLEFNIPQRPVIFDT
jgi:hypothetical protein